MRDPSAQLVVHVKPRASRDRILGWRPDGALRMRVAAPPVEGAANKRVIALLAKTCGVPKRQVTILSGTTSPVKRIRIEGRSGEEVHALIRTHEPSRGEG